MKKIFFGILAIVAMVATSCQQEMDLGVNGGDTATITFEIGTPQMRSYSDGTKANLLKYVVYTGANDETFLGEISATDGIAFDGNDKLSLELAINKHYTILFWAQNENANNYYTLNTANKTITVDYSGAACNDDNRDAFYGVLSHTVTGATTLGVQLKRPFAQLNVGAGDFEAARKAGLVPAESKLVVKGVCNTLNLLSGAADGSVEATFATADINKTEAFPVSGYDYLAMSYVLVGKDESAHDVTYTITAEDNTVIEREIGAAPLRANYRTNIYGKLLTSTTDVNVEIKPGYEGEYNGVVEVSTADLFTAAFANPEVDFIVLTQDITLTTSATRTTPTLTVSAGESVTINLNGHRLTAATPQLFNVLGELSLINGTIENTATDGKVLADNDDATLSNVTILQSTDSAYFDEQGDELALIAEGVAKVSENAEGAPTEIAIIASCGMSWLDENIDKDEYKGFEGMTIKLETDIDLTGTEWNPIGDNRGDDDNKYFKGTFDGQNHTIKGASKSSFDGSNYGSKEGWGIFSVVEGATIKNLNIDNATFASYTVISGAVAGYASNTTFENINITNTKVAGYNWYTGGVVGWAQDKCTFKGINLDSSVSVGTLWDSHGQNAGGIAGGVSSSAEITIEDCNIACVLDVINDVTSNYKWYIYRVSGMIIGNTNTTETKYNEVVTATATNVTCNNVTVTYGDWMNYHYCQGYWNRGWGRYESSDYVGGVDEAEPHNHAAGEQHYVWIPFDQLFGGSSNGSGHYPVKGLREFPGVTVNYPESFYREQGYKAEGNTYSIYSGEGFKTIATTVLADGTKDVTIELANDIDLAGIEWPAVKTAAAFVLDGKGYAIKNLTTSAVEDHGFYSTAMFTSTRKATTIKNLVVENATVTGQGGDNSHGAVLVACNYAALNIEGVTVKNSTVSNCDRSSVIATYLYFTNATVKNCVVEGCTVNSIGTAGALLGMNNSHNFEATGNTVKNTTISSSEGSNKAGILIGTWQDAGTLTESGNVVENSKAINAGTETNNNIGRHA